MPRRLFPGGGNTWSVPFCICDLQFFICEHTFCTSGEPLSDLQHSDFSSLVFNDQHNAVRREYIVNGRCGHTHDCDILWILSCVRCLNSCVAPATTPLCAIHISTGWHSIRNAKITSTLRSACDTSVYRLGITSTTYPPIPFDMVGKFPSFWVISTPTQSKSSAAGAVMRCSSIFMSRPIPSCADTPQPWFPQGGTPSPPWQLLTPDIWVYSMDTRKGSNRAMIKPRQPYQCSSVAVSRLFRCSDTLWPMLHCHIYVLWVYFIIFPLWVSLYEILDIPGASLWYGVIIVVVWVSSFLHKFVAL